MNKKTIFITSDLIVKDVRYVITDEDERSISDEDTTHIITNEMITKDLTKFPIRRKEYCLGSDNIRMYVADTKRGVYAFIQWRLTAAEYKALQRNKRLQDIIAAL